MNEENKSAVDEFFQQLPEEDKKEANIFDDKKEDTVIAEQDEDPETAPESIKDRRHRRLEEKLQKERESNIALNERLKVVTESKRVSVDEGIDERLLDVFGTSDVGKQIAQKFSSVLNEVKQETRESTLKQIEEQQALAQSEEKGFENFIDTQLESLEDTYNVDLTSNSKQAKTLRSEFLELVERLSPKDDEGNLEAYADFNSTFEIYKNSKVTDKTATRQKEIASKSMQRSSNQENKPQEITPGFRGWEKDLNINDY